MLVMKLSSLLEVVTCVHLSKYVQTPFDARGGLMLVAPPGHLKSATLKALNEFPTTHLLSDLNVQQLIRLREDIVAGGIATLVFSDFEKLYQRSDTVSSNLEGILKALIEEGFRKASFEDSRAGTMPAFATIIGAMTTGFHGRMISKWADNGFARRFIWSLYKLQDPGIIERAISQWSLLNLTESGSGTIVRVPANGRIEYNISKEEDKILNHMLRFQMNTTPYILLKKIFCVLKWRYSDKKRKPMEIMIDFGASLTKDGCVVMVEDELKTPLRLAR